MSTLDQESPLWPAEEAAPDGGVDVDADEEAAAPFDPSADLPSPPPRVFISHKCDVDPDEQVAAMLHTDLTEMGYEVYLDKVQPPGAVYDEAISDSLKNADYVVALITRHSNESDWVKYELSFAADGRRRRGRPVIIPVRLGFAEQYSPIIGASVGTINALYCDPGDYRRLLEGVREGLTPGRQAWSPQVVGIDGFLVKDFRKALTRAATADSLALRRAGDALRREGVLWVVGDDGVKNHFARTIAVREHDRAGAADGGARPDIYEVPRSLGFAKVDDTLVRGSVIIFADATPSVLFDEEARRDELKALKNLAGRNAVIVTASDDSYAEIEREMRNRDFERGPVERVGPGLYDEKAKLGIFERLLDFSHESLVVLQRQHSWGRRLLEDAEAREVFRPILGKWTPADIERFVTQHLRQAKRPGDVVKLLQRNADLDDEIHTWFAALDDSTRCFVLALTMLYGLRREQFWDNYKLIVQRLRKLEAKLSLWPLGICCRRAAPYVTTEGQFGFGEDRVADAVHREVAGSFREYLVELVPLMREMSVPPGRERKATAEAAGLRRLQAAESRALRTALARAVGKAGRQGLEDLRGLLEFWGADPLMAVREAVAVALAETASEPTGARYALALLEAWCYDASPRAESLYRTWAAASALASVAAARPPWGDTYERALVLLERLAAASHPSTRFYVSIALKKVARRRPLAEPGVPVTLERLLQLVAQDGRAATKINVAEALVEARIADESAVGVVRDWASADEVERRWPGMCSLLLWRKQTGEERDRDLAAFLARDAATTASVLVELLNHGRQRGGGGLWQSFQRMVLGADRAKRGEFVSGLAALPPPSLEERLLPLLRASEDPALSGLVAEVRVERWRATFSAPAEFVEDLRREAGQAALAPEVYTALTRLAQPEPGGCRAELTQTLVRCFAECRAALDDALTRLKRIAPSTFGPLCVEVRYWGLLRLLDDPPAFVAAAADGLSRAELSADTLEALELLARPDQQASREAMLKALADARALDANAARALLRQFRGSGGEAVGGLAYEFSLRSLSGDLPEPGRFLARVTDATRDAYERAEVLHVLRQLSAPEPEGRRRALVRALGAVRATRPAEVDALLRDRSWQSPDGLLGLGAEVKLFSFVSSYLSPGIASAIFDPRS